MTDETTLERLLCEWLACEPEETVEAFIARHPEHATLLREHYAMEELVEIAFEPETNLPERIGPFRIEAELGTGGMGTVYRAVVDEPERGFTVGETVALKVVHPHLFRRRGFFKRFLREAELGRRIEHANVVRTLDVDAVESEDRPQHYLVMEYVEGQTLRDLTDDVERVPEELARHIGCEVAKALSAIHAAGAVHRDLKPENVLITPDHVVKVMDLGVARLVEEQVRLSQTGAFVGSLQYAAPEQFGGKTEVDYRADLHGLGLLLYEIATGTNPYAHADAGAAMRLILTEEPRKAGELNPQLSPFFEEVLARLLQKEPSARFGSADEVLGILAEAEQSVWWHTHAKAIRASSKRPLRRIRIPRETAVRGRDEDLAKLHALYEKVRAGDGQVLLIEGEAGIGKTRLVDEFVGRLRRKGEDVNFLFGSYPPGGAATTAGAFSTAYREHFGEERLEDALKKHLTLTPVLVPALSALLRGDARPTNAEPLTKDSLQTVFTHVTQGLASERTTIVLIDDLHFAPEDGRALFSSLAMAVPGHRILLLGMMRPGVSDAWSANLSRLDHARQHTLPRLGPKDLANLLEDAFHSERLARELGHLIAVKSDGNPFFALEMIQGLKEGQFFTQKPDGSWVTSEVIRDIQVPSSVLELVRARIADLDDVDRELLDVAACCGFEFEPGLVAAVCERPVVPTLRRLAHVESKHRLVRSSGRRFVFDHHQVQEALYGAQPEQLRESYHAAIAKALEEHKAAKEADPSDLDGALCVELCDHFLKGARGDKALRYLDAATSHLQHSYLSGPMIALLERALATPDLLHGMDRVWKLLRLGNSNGPLWRLGLRERQLAVCEEAVRLAEDTRDLRAMGVARGSLGGVLQVLGRYDEAQEHHEAHLRLAREDGDRENESRANGNLGVISRERGRYTEALEYSRRQGALAREIGYRWGEAASAGNVGSVLMRLARFDEAHEAFESQLTLYRELGDRAGEVRALTNLGVLLPSLSRIAEAVEVRERSVALARAIGDRMEEGIAAVNLGALWRSLGQKGPARQMLELSLALNREVGARRPEGYSLSHLGRLAWEEGDGEEAMRRAQEALVLRREIGHGGGVVDSLIQVAELHARAGELAEARVAIEEAVALSHKHQSVLRVPHALAFLATLHGGDVSAALAALDEVGEVADGFTIRFLLWQASGDKEHLKAAKLSLDRQTVRIPGEYQESMLKNVRLHREIMEAWEEHGERA